MSTTDDRRALHHEDRLADPPAWIAPAPVREWMQHPVIAVSPTTSVAEAGRVMRQARIRHLPILGGGGRLLGIVTDRDLRNVGIDVTDEAVSDDVSITSEIAVRDLMTWTVVSVRPDSDLRDAARLMREQRIGALPVVAGGRVVGMLSEVDLLRALEETLRSRVVTVRPAESLDEEAGT